MAHEPVADSLMLAGSVVVENDVDELSDRDVSVQSIQEADKRLMPVMLHFPPEGLAGGGCSTPQTAWSCRTAL